MSTHPWPLLGLRVDTPRLELRLPREEEFGAFLDATDAGIHDPDEMPFETPWTDTEPAELRHRASMQFWWGSRASWTPDDWHLTLGVFLDGRAIGFQDLVAKRFCVLRTVASGSWLTRDAQGEGYGTEMRSGVLDLAFTGLGAAVAHSAAFVDNIASRRVSQALGYRENGRERAAPRGEARELTRFELTRADWESRRPEWRATITGLEPCLPLFGLDPSDSPESTDV